MSTRTVHDPFHGVDVKISNRLVDRLRGKYACGPMLENGEPEFGWRQMPQIPIQMEAADMLDRLRQRIADLESLLHDCDAALEKVWPHFGGKEVEAIGRLQQRIIDAVSN